MKLQTIPATLALAVAIHLTGCDRAPAPRQPAGSAQPAPPPSPPAPPASSPASAAAPAATTDPAAVLAAWAAAVTARDWPRVRAFWGHDGADSGLDGAAFAARWGALTAPRVTLGPASVEGAAGSLYYDAPVTIVDGARRLEGRIVLRRVNDVDGSTPAQRRWHIVSTTLAP